MSELTEYEAERAVIDAAIEERGLLGSIFSATTLSRAVDALLAAREPQWVAGRTWADVRAGDTVRLPGADSVHVLTMTVYHWNVSEERGPWNEEQRAYEVIRQEHSQIGVRLAEYPESGIMRMPPAGKVEILLSAVELAAIELIGWENRVHVSE